MVIDNFLVKWALEWASELNLITPQRFEVGSKEAAPLGRSFNFFAGTEAMDGPKTGLQFFTFLLKYVTFGMNLNACYLVDLLFSAFAFKWFLVQVNEYVYVEINQYV